MPIPLPNGVDEPRKGWRADAKCQGDDPRKFDLTHIASNVAPIVREMAAAELCAGCPVIRDCAADAYRHESTGVVRGGVFTRTPQTPALIEAARQKRNNQ